MYSIRNPKSKFFEWVISAASEDGAFTDHINDGYSFRQYKRRDSVPLESDHGVTFILAPFGFGKTKFLISRIKESMTQFDYYMLDEGDVSEDVVNRGLTASNTIWDYNELHEIIDAHLVNGTDLGIDSISYFAREGVKADISFVTAEFGRWLVALNKAARTRRIRVYLTINPATAREDVLELLRVRGQSSCSVFIDLGSNGNKDGLKSNKRYTSDDRTKSSSETPPKTIEKMRIPTAHGYALSSLESIGANINRGN